MINYNKRYNVYFNAFCIKIIFIHKINITIFYLNEHIENCFTKMLFLILNISLQIIKYHLIS